MGVYDLRSTRHAGLDGRPPGRLGAPASDVQSAALASMTTRALLKQRAFGATPLMHLRGCPGAALEHLLFRTETCGKSRPEVKVWWTRTAPVGTGSRPG